MNIKDPNGMTALAYAALCKNEQAIQLLLKAGAVVGFLEAILLGDEETARCLRDPSINLNTAYRGDPLLPCVVATGQLHVARLLLEMGADVNAAVDFAQTALAMAIVFRREDLVRLLLGYRATIHPRDYATARRLGYDEIVVLLEG